jgi:hypothetical protein
MAVPIYNRSVKRGGLSAAGLVLAGTIVLCGPAQAGMVPDPRPGDEFLGKEGGLAYVVDAETVTNSSYTEANAACPQAGGAWRVVGGGFEVQGAPPESERRLSASRPLDMHDSYGDDDDELDDFWQTSIAAPLASTLETYAICSRWARVKQRFVSVPNGPSGERQATNRCARGELSGGGGFIATSGSFISSMYPKDESRWTLELADALGGIGGMGNYWVCVRGEDLRLGAASESVPSGEAGAAFVRCDNGRHVTGGGARAGGAPSAMNLFASYPVDLGDPDDAPDDAWLVGAYNRSASAKTLKAYAICAG